MMKFRDPEFGMAGTEDRFIPYSAFRVPRSGRGFTLIELIVVISLISIVLFFSMPRFQDAVVMNQANKFSRWIILKTQTLKERSAQEKALYTLHIGMDSGKVWISNASMSEESLLEAEENGYDIPEDVRVLDVEYPDKGIISIGAAEICFYKNGYSDKVLIHIEDDDGEQRTFLIEPFLSKVKIYEEYVGFEG
ncbi:type II secretion system protein [Desulfobacterales bacterium HSG2]|nr:type II secretion system protein [Desulfobacterales bacterium HSG2]